MTSDRPYRRALTYGEAIAALADGRGRQWDDEIADVMIALAAEDRNSSTDANLSALTASFFEPAASYPETSGRSSRAAASRSVAAAHARRLVARPRYPVLARRHVQPPRVAAARQPFVARQCRSLPTHRGQARRYDRPSRMCANVRALRAAHAASGSCSAARPRGQVDRDLPLPEAELVLGDAIAAAGWTPDRAQKPQPTPSVSRCSLITTRVTPTFSASTRSRVISTSASNSGGGGPKRSRTDATASSTAPIVARGGELLVDRDLLRDLRDVVVGNVRVELHVDHRFARVLRRASCTGALCARRSLRPAAARTSRSRPRR